MEDNENVNESNDEAGITMVDVLKETEELESNAEAVLGPGDDSACTYDLGNMKRQALYACTSCCPLDKNVRAAICLGCSYHCHEGHELVELYTKRNFRCDCGNSKFPESNPCKLNKEKGLVNEANTYNQNFASKYCTCSRPYPDLEDKVDDQMIQCILCEDWYHGRHLKIESLPCEDDFSEMVCHVCAAAYPFLGHYTGYTVTHITKEETNGTVEVVESSQPKPIEGCPSKETDRIEDLHIKDVVPSKEVNIENGCKLSKCLPADKLTEALFLVEDWRKHLCLCSACKKMYSDLKLEYLTNEEDTVSYYESQGEAKQADRGIQRELDALSTLDRITRTEMVHEYNNLSTSLREYLKKFADNGKVVTDEHIKEFFSEMHAKKRQKTDGISYFCK